MYKSYLEWRNLKERKEKKMLERYVWNTGALEKLRMPKKILPP